MLQKLNTQPVLAATAPPPLPSPSCPCSFPIRRIYAGELICPSCGRRETVAREFWEAVQAACVRGLSGVRGWNQ